MGRISKTYKIITCINLLEDNRTCGGIIIKDIDTHDDRFYCQKCKALYSIPTSNVDLSSVELNRCKIWKHRTNNPDDTRTVRCFGTIILSESGHYHICSRCGALYDL